MELKVTLHESTHEPVTAMIGLAGSVTVRESVELREALVSALAAADKVLLDVGGITETDPSFFQLLCSARQTAEAAGRELALAPGHSDACGEAALAAAFPFDGSLTPGEKPLREE